MDSIKVKELVALLNKQPQDLRIYVSNGTLGRLKIIEKDSVKQHIFGNKLFISTSKYATNEKRAD